MSLQEQFRACFGGSFEKWSDTLRNTTDLNNGMSCLQAAIYQNNHKAMRVALKFPDINFDEVVEKYLNYDVRVSDVIVSDSRFDYKKYKDFVFGSCGSNKLMSSKVILWNTMMKYYCDSMEEKSMKTKETPKPQEIEQAPSPKNNNCSPIDKRILSDHIYSGSDVIKFEKDKCLSFDGELMRSMYHLEIIVIENVKGISRFEIVSGGTTAIHAFVDGSDRISVNVPLGRNLIITANEEGEANITGYYKLMNSQRRVSGKICILQKRNCLYEMAIIDEKISEISELDIVFDEEIKTDGKIQLSFVSENGCEVRSYAPRKINNVGVVITVADVNLRAIYYITLQLSDKKYFRYANIIN